MTLLDLHLGRPLHRGALTLFPIWNGAAVSARGYDLRTPLLSVDERAGSAVVGELVVRNAGARPALLLEGELLEGGQQHRVAARSVLVGAGESLVLDVRCVEQGRWSGSSSHDRHGHRAPVSVRAAEDQGAVWEEVDRFEQRYGAGATRSLLDVTRRVAPVPVDDLRALPFQAGVLVGVAGQPLLLEVYDSPRTLAHAWTSLLRSVAVDAAGRPPVPTPGRRARRFLDRLGSVPLAGSPAGAATGVTGRSPYARLDALLWRDRAVHAVAVNPRHELVAA
jgi:hypothetical protein